MAAAAARVARAPRSRRFAGNINQGDGQTLPHWDDLPEGVRYLYWQKEKGATGRPHLQMYVETTAPQTKTWLVRKLGGYWELAKGTVEQNQVYCGKDEGRLDGPWELGTAVKQGQSHAIAVAAQEVKKRGYSAAFEDHPTTFIRYGRGLKEYDSLCRKKARGNEYRAPEILVLVGPPGCGKTRLAREIPSKGVYIQNGTKWWNDYQGEETILLDDFYGQIPYAELLRLVDGYPQMKETKGGHTYLDVKRWIFTSNSPPWEWYSKMEASKEALYDRLWRRFDSLVIELPSYRELCSPGCACVKCFTPLTR